MLRARHFSKNKGLIQFNQMKNWHTPNYRFGKSEGERQYIRRKLIFFFLISIVVLIDCISKFFEKKLQKYQYCIIIFVLLQSLSVMLKLLLRLSYCNGTHTYKRRFLDALVLTLWELRKLPNFLSETKQRERPMKLWIFMLSILWWVKCLYWLQRGAFSVARFDRQGNAKTFKAWTGHRTGSTFFMFIVEY